MLKKEVYRRHVRTIFAVLLSLIVTAWLIPPVFAATDPIDFSQCVNDNGAGSKHDGVIDQCQWSQGAINAVNSDYAESDGVPQRVIFLHTANSDNEQHSFTFQYDFTKNNIYAYDFLANVDHTMPMSLINPCGNLPSFTDTAQCEAAFDPAVRQSVPIDTDTFDSVSGAEHPPYPDRAMIVACKSLSVGGTDKCTNFTYSISHDTSTCYQNCGTSTAQVTLGFETQTAGQYLIMVYFSGELSSSSFWGTGYGASSAPGASFHMKLTDVDGSPAGGQDNQIQVPKAAHHADLAITKSAPATIAAGNELTYTISVTNKGPDTATAVVVNDTLPLSSHVTYVPPATPSQGTCSPLSGNNLTCDLGLLEPNGTATITVTLNVDASTANGTQLINTVTVTGNITDDTPDDNTDQTTTTVTNLPPNPNVDLSITKSDVPDPVTAGSNLTYTIDVTNNSTVNTATGVTMTDSLPPQTTFVSSAPAQPTCSESGGIVTCNLPDLAAGASTHVTIQVNVKASTPDGKIYNTATVTGNQPDPTPGNNSTTIDTTVVSKPDLAITKAASPEPVTSGDQLTYTLHVTNTPTIAEPSDAFNVTVTDTLPPEATFISASTGCSAVGQVVTCAISHLAVGQSQDFNIVVLVNSAVPTTITNTAVVTPLDDTLSDTTATVDTTVNIPEVPADVSIVKSAPGTVAMGASFDYSLSVTNIGQGTATHVTITDVLPVEVSFVSATPNICSVANGVLTCQLGDMTNGASQDITVTVQVNPSFFGIITNTAVVAAGGDNNPDNNQSTVNTTVPQPPPPPPPPPAAPVAVPTINEWGMILFMLLAGIGAVSVLLKKRRT